MLSFVKKKMTGHFFVPVPSQNLDLQHYMLWSLFILCSVSESES